jgi:hypothetical protein
LRLDLKNIYAQPDLGAIILQISSRLPPSCETNEEFLSAAEYNPSRRVGAECDEMRGIRIVNEGTRENIRTVLAL